MDIRVWFVVGISLLSACRPDANTSEAHSDSGIFGPAYAKILDELRSLEATHKDLVQYIDYGRTVGGQELGMVRIGKAGSKNGAAVLISGSVHGDEYLNIEDRLPRWFAENSSKGGVAKFLDGGGVIFIAPIVNPDGYTARTRANARGADLNRDFELKRASKGGFAQPETKLLVETVRRELAVGQHQLKVTLDYHCCVGALIYPWAHTSAESLPASEVLEHKRLAKIMLQDLPGYPTGRAFQIVGYTALGGADDFYHEAFGSRSFTFEGAVNRENGNFEEHTALWDRVLADQAGPATATTPPAAATTQALTLAIATDDGSAQLRLAASAVQASSMTICAGGAVACLANGAVELVRFGNARKLGDRLIFDAERSVGIQVGQQYTVLAKDPAGNTTASQVVQFTLNDRTN